MLKQLIANGIVLVSLLSC